MVSAQKCHRCNDLDLDSIFDRADYDNRLSGFAVAEIKNLSNENDEIQCALCLFLRKTSDLVRRAEKGSDFHLRAYSYAGKVGLEGPAEQVPKKLPKNEMVLCLAGGSIENYELPDFGRGNELILPVRAISEDAKDLSVAGRQVKQEELDYTLLKSWLDYCSQQHVAACPLVSSSLPALKVIDCQSGLIVRLPPNSQYLALSYCIGISAADMKNLRLQNTTSKQFPCVVMDAMQFTLKLGFQYLWVDQFSIEQDNPTDLQEGISNMHKIYSEAFAVIISLGDSQSRGLPGVSNIKRRGQPTLSTSKTTFISTMDSIDIALRKSKYTTRGWTYQESLLGKRLIIFAPDQIHFICNGSAFRESLWCAKMDNAKSDFVLPIRPDAFTPVHQFMMGVDGWVFGELLRAYSQRCFTFESDILNAFNGVLTQCEHSSYLGVPIIMRTPEKSSSYHIEQVKPPFSLAFATGLSWSTSYNNTNGIHNYSRSLAPTTEVSFRRPEFPSWAWPSCKTYNCPLTYKIRDNDVSETKELDAYEVVDAGEIQITIQTGNDTGEMSIGEAFKTAADSRILKVTSSYVFIESIVVPIHLCQVDFEGDQSIAKFCIDIEDSSNSALSGIEDENTSKRPKLDFGGQLEDDRFVVDLDRPPTTEDGYYRTLLNQEFLGILLFKEKSVIEEPHLDAGLYGTEDDYFNSYCLMITRNQGEYYERVGIVWVEHHHFTLLPQHRKRIKLG